MSFLSKQWEGVWSLSPVLVFDESRKIDDDDVALYELVNQHRNFINILQRYLEFREKDKTTQVLDKFRLRMTRYLDRDSGIVNKWLSFACERSVKEVDLSLEIAWNKQLEFYYCLSPISLLNANSALSVLIWECPSIEFLSLNTCSFEDSAFRVSSSNLKSLEITHCDARYIRVDKAVNLEYFTFSSEFWVQNMTLNASFNLKYISIHARGLRNLSLQGCHHSAKANIHTPGLLLFDFHGFLKSKLSLEAPYLRTAIIALSDIYDGESHYFSELRDFLKAFDGIDQINLHVCDFKGLIFPENFRETFSSPLTSLKYFGVYMSNSPTKAKDYSEIKASMTWMAPSATRFWYPWPRLPLI
ncbi:hypothetical protein M0R45_015730 [Rubus argutus]|uniref:At1g61320/AtMIF1 LRR domain-containing protein n=1 Tax=Rubus argutus TaxID=59490 RepID=A0AAW1XRM5_RUBAR